MSQQVVVQNLLKHAFSSLKEKDRYVAEGQSKSTFELFFDRLNIAFEQKLYKPSNAEVESFYRGSTSEADFVATVMQHVISKVKDLLDTDLNPLMTICWDMYCTIPRRKELCERVPRLSGRQLWAVFNKMDTESRCVLHLDDIIDLVMKMHFECRRPQTAKNIQEWFCDQVYVDFWSFFSALAENHMYLLQAQIIHTVYEQVFYEVLKQGKMTKKGHKIASWKERWFVLTTSSLAYYESLTNRTLKGSVAITEKSHVDKIPAVKGKQYLFRVTDGLNEKPYEISAQDPQMLEDWVEMLNVVIALHNETGRNLLHRLRLARERLSSGKALPVYKKEPNPNPAYPIGSYETLTFTMPLDQIDLAKQNANPVSVRELPPLPPAEDREHPLRPASPAKSPTEGVKLRKKPTPPQVLPYKRRSSSPQIQAMSFPFMVDEVTRVPALEMPQEPVKQGTPNPRPVSPHGRRSSVPDLEFGEAVSHVNVDGLDYALLDNVLENGREEPLKSEKSSDKAVVIPLQPPGSPRHSPLRGTKSAGYVLGKSKLPNSDYIELAFHGDGQLKMKPESDKEMISVKPALKTRFNYTTVVPMSPDGDVVHDVAKALELKATKPAMPPPPPRPYNAHTEENDTSATYDNLTDNHNTPPAPPPRTSAPTVPVRHGMTRNTYSDAAVDQSVIHPRDDIPVIGFIPSGGAISTMMPREGSPPPPPVPRREHSAGKVPGNESVTPPRPVPRRNIGYPLPPIPSSH